VLACPSGRASGQRDFRDGRGEDDRAMLMEQDEQQGDQRLDFDSAWSQPRDNKLARASKRRSASEDAGRHRPSTHLHGGTGSAATITLKRTCTSPYAALANFFLRRAGKEGLEGARFTKPFERVKPIWVRFWCFF
jgi:hypothetical protein